MRDGGTFDCEIKKMEGLSVTIFLIAVIGFLKYFKDHAAKIRKKNCAFHTTTDFFFKIFSTIPFWDSAFTPIFQSATRNVRQPGV